MKTELCLLLRKFHYEDTNFSLTHQVSLNWKVIIYSQGYFNKLRGVLPGSWLWNKNQQIIAIISINSYGSILNIYILGIKFLTNPWFLLRSPH